MTFSPVVSLIIIESADEIAHNLRRTDRVLACVRRGETNAHHPDVLSVPTQRIPACLLETIIKESTRMSTASSGAALEGAWVSSDSDSGHHPIIYCVESLLAQKLGISEAAISKANPLAFRAKAVWLERGFASYTAAFNLPAEREAIDMLGIVVTVADTRSFPNRTGSYDPILWTTIAQLLEAYERKAVELVDPHLDSVRLCIHGLCVKTAYEYLKSELHRSDVVNGSVGNLQIA